jgi:hypothetical protein
MIKEKGALKMEDFDNLNGIDEELKKLEDEFSNDDNVMRELAAPSAADYWKKRLEEEKELWSKMIETKEEEKKALQAKLSKQEKDLVALREDVKKIQSGYAEESQAWQERFKTKETELLLEKERVGWDEKFRGLQYENKILQEEFERSKKYYEEEMSGVRNAHGKELEELISAQNALVENLDSLEREIGEMEKMTGSYREEKETLGKELALRETKLAELAEKLARAQAEKAELAARADYFYARAGSLKEQYSQYLSCMTDYFFARVRDNIGTVLGIIGYCFRRLGLKKAVKRQMIVMSEASERMLKSMDAVAGLVAPGKLELQDFSAERLLSRLCDNADASCLPPGLKVKANYAVLAEALCPYADRAVKSGVSCRAVPAGNILGLEITVQGKIEVNPEFIRLRHVVFMHEWDMSTAFENNNTKLLIEIPAIEAG